MIKLEKMRVLLGWASLFLFLIFSFGCANQHVQPKAALTKRQRIMQAFIDRCDKANPPWSEGQRKIYRDKAKAKAVLVTKAIRANPKMAGAKLKVNDWPEAINASCYDARQVSIEGVVAKPEQKRILNEICIKYSDKEINVSMGAIGTGFGGTG
jgi:hypothetical protein